MRKFLIDILNTLDIGLDATRVGVVQYSSQVLYAVTIQTFFCYSDQQFVLIAYLICRFLFHKNGWRYEKVTDVGSHLLCVQVRNEFSLKTHGKLDNMVKAINEIVPLAQGTMTGLAIRYLMNEAFSLEQGDRPKVCMTQTAVLNQIVLFTPWEQTLIQTR